MSLLNVARHKMGYTRFVCAHHGVWVYIRVVRNEVFLSNCLAHLDSVYVPYEYQNCEVLALATHGFLIGGVDHITGDVMNIRIRYYVKRKYLRVRKSTLMTISYVFEGEESEFCVRFYP